MKIVIIGDGKVGYKLAKQLSEENYDVVMIDNNAARLESASNTLDVFCVKGDGVSSEVQTEADVQHADLVVACASSDEQNMLSCLVARRLGAKHTIARVRNPIYYKQIDVLKEDLHLSMAINPEHVVANEIARVLIFPAADKVEVIMKGRMELVEFQLKNDNDIIGYKLVDIYKKYLIKLLVVAVKRGNEVFIPDGEFVLEKGDKLYIAATHANIERFFGLIGNHKNKVKKVIICGGGRVGYYLAKQLCSLNMEVKLIEYDMEKCEFLCEQLPKATIICGDATEHDLLIEEGVREADAFVALTGVDEENIIMSLFAKKQGVNKIVAKVNEDSRVEMIEGFGIDCIVSAKTATADAIYSYIAAKQNSLSNSNVESLYRLVDDRVEALEFEVKEETKYTNIPLKDLKTKPNILIACIGRNEEVIIPNGNDCIMPGDVVVVVTKAKKIRDITDILR